MSEATPVDCRCTQEHTQRPPSLARSPPALWLTTSIALAWADRSTSASHSNLCPLQECLRRCYCILQLDKVKQHPVCAHVHTHVPLMLACTLLIAPGHWGLHVIIVANDDQYLTSPAQYSRGTTPTSSRKFLSCEVHSDGGEPALGDPVCSFLFAAH